MNGLSILVADDDPVIRRFLEKRLTGAGYDVTVAENGIVAARHLGADHFDVVLTDLMMPGDIGGIELLDIAKAEDINIDVIVITAHSSINTAVAAMKKGAVDYLEKPVNFDELLLRLEKIADLKSLARDADDLRAAMDVTEKTAARTIQDLEMMLSRLQLKLDQIEELVNDPDKTGREIIQNTKEILAEDATIPIS